MASRADRSSSGSSCRVPGEVDDDLDALRRADQDLLALDRGGHQPGFGRDLRHPYAGREADVVGLKFEALSNRSRYRRG